MKFAIRDDDTSYFTTPEELEKAYDFIKEGCISLSVVPNTVYAHKNTVFPYGKDNLCGEFDISENKELVGYLKQNKKENRYDILLHGYNHEYKLVNDSWKAELLWKDHDRIYQELKLGKEKLENLFDCEISVLVAPNNCINKKGIDAVEKLGMNYSGIIQFFDRKISFKYIINFVKRWSFRFFKKMQYPKLLDYGKHKELTAYALDNFERLKKEYMECKKKNTPFVIYSHYWYVNQNEKTKEILKQIYDYVIADGAKLVALSDLF